MRIIQQVNQITMKVMKKEILHCSPGGEQNQNTCATGLNEASSTIERVSVIGATKRQHCTLQFSIDWKEYSEIMPASETACRFTSEWTELMYKHFHRQYAMCPLAFTGNRLSKKDSWKKRTRFWVGRTNCKVLNCIAVVFEIRDEPVPNQSVKVDVSITGSRIHANDPLVKRQAVSEAGMISLYSFQSIENCSVQCCLFVAPITETLSIVDEASFNPVAQVFWFCSPPGEQCSISFFITFMVIWFTCCIIRIKSKGIMFW